MLAGKYRVLDHLGAGRMADVFLGEIVGVEAFSRRVALKRILPGLSDDLVFSTSLVAAAELGSRLIHPNIVALLDLARDEHQQWFVVTDLVDGCDLDALRSAGLLPLSVTLYVIREVLRGLAHAHTHPIGEGASGVLHRDISPHNILVSRDGAVKVSDFGMARARDASEATGSTFARSKLGYLSPEQASGQPLDPGSDLFSVGVIMWEMLVGRRLFVGSDMRNTLVGVIFAAIPSPRQVRSQVPERLDRIVMRLLERDRTRRYRSANEVLVDLQACGDADGAREALAGLVATRTAAGNVQATPQVELPTTLDLPRVPGERSRRRSVKLPVAVGVCVAVAAAIVVSTRREPPTTGSEAGGSATPAAGPHEGANQAAFVPPLELPPVNPQDFPPNCAVLVRKLIELTTCPPGTPYLYEREQWARSLENLRGVPMGIRRFGHENLVSEERDCEFELKHFGPELDCAGHPKR